MGYLFLPALLGMIFMSSSFAPGSSSALPEPCNTTCIDGFGLLFFEEKKTYDKAKATCETLGGYLAKVDNQKITDAISSGNCESNSYITYFIGGDDRTKEGDWKWLDGTDIPMRNETGYQNWDENEPNDRYGSEDCLVHHTRVDKWNDMPCGARFNFVCQRESRRSLLEMRDISETQKKCSKTECTSATRVEWFKASTKVTTDRAANGVYQTQQSGSSIINLQRARIADAGDYRCYIWIEGTGKVKSTFIYEVYGNPVIHQISNNVCNSNLVVLWQPNENAIGFPHKIEVIPHSPIWVDSRVSESESESGARSRESEVF